MLVYIYRRFGEKYCRCFQGKIVETKTVFPSKLEKKIPTGLHSVLFSNDWPNLVLLHNVVTNKSLPYLKITRTLILLILLFEQLHRKNSHFDVAEMVTRVSRKFICKKRTSYFLISAINMTFNVQRKTVYIAAAFDIKDKMYKRVFVASIRATLKNQYLRPHRLCLDCVR